MGFSRQEYWSGQPFPSLPDPGMEPESPALPANSLPPRKPHTINTNPKQLKYVLHKTKSLLLFIFWISIHTYTQRGTLYYKSTYFNKYTYINIYVKKKTTYLLKLTTWVSRSIHQNHTIGIIPAQIPAPSPHKHSEFITPAKWPGWRLSVIFCIASVSTHSNPYPASVCFVENHAVTCHHSEHSVTNIPSMWSLTLPGLRRTDDFPRLTPRSWAWPCDHSWPLGRREEGVPFLRKSTENPMRSSRVTRDSLLQ